DGGRAVTGCYDHSVRFWDLETGKMLFECKGHGDSVMSIAYSPDGRLAVSGGSQSDPALHLWDAATGTEVRPLKGHGERIMGVAFAPDGRRIVSGCWDRTGRLRAGGPGQGG